MVFVIFSILNVLTYSIQLTRLLVKINSFHSNTYMSIFIHQSTYKCDIIFSFPQ